MGKKLTIKLTPREARILWAVLDGALDAGAVEDGMTSEENAILAPITSKLLRFVDTHRIEASAPIPTGGSGC
jgi:hypothetical protein